MIGKGLHFWNIDYLKIDKKVLFKNASDIFPLNYHIFDQIYSTVYTSKAFSFSMHPNPSNPWYNLWSLFWVICVTSFSSISYCSIISVITNPHKQDMFIGVVRKHHKCYMLFLTYDISLKLLLLLYKSNLDLVHGNWGDSKTYPEWEYPFYNIEYPCFKGRASKFSFPFHATQAR